jgi:MinD-like ATPase involved in chromosome partitioning or flagellar assembly
MSQNLISRFLASPKTSLSQTQLGNTISVWGPHGSTGKTTIATNLAIELANLGKRVFLLDADCYGPSVASHFGLAEHPAGLAAACRLANQERFDLDQLTRLSVSFVREKLIVMTGLTSVSRWPEVNPNSLAEIIRLAKTSFDFVVLDIASNFEVTENNSVQANRNIVTRNCLATSDLVVACGLADPVGIFRLLSLQEELEALCANKPLWVINRLRTQVLGPNAKHQVTETLKRLGEIDVALFLPEDSVNLDQAMLIGQPLSLTSGKGGFRQALQAFTKDRVLKLGQD